MRLLMFAADDDGAWRITMSAADRFNEYAQKHGAKKEVWEEDLKFKYQNKSMREYRASIYGLPYQEFPKDAFTSEPAYLRRCIAVSGMMPSDRGRGFKQFMRERLAEAEDEEIPPNMEEGVEVGVVVLTVLKNKIRNARNFDYSQEEDELRPGEWLFLETAEDSKCGLEVYIKYEGLKGCILDYVALGQTETKLPRKDVVSWLLAHGRHHGKDASINRRRCAYVLPFSLVDGFEVFGLRSATRVLIGGEAK
jgi:hypothetical protein